MPDIDINQNVQASSGQVSGVSIAQVGAITFGANQKPMTAFPALRYRLIALQHIIATGQNGISKSEYEELLYLLGYYADRVSGFKVRTWQVAILVAYVLIVTIVAVVGILR